MNNTIELKIVDTLTNLAVDLFVNSISTSAFYNESYITNGKRTYKDKSFIYIISTQRALYTPREELTIY